MTRSEIASNAMLNLTGECFLIDILSMDMAFFVPERRFFAARIVGLGILHYTFAREITVDSDR
jgi:hypothetical protein